MSDSAPTLVDAFVHNPIKVAVGVLLTVLFGVIALFRLPVELTPEVQTPTITIETRWPGSSPEEVEREIVHEQEEQLKSVEGLTKLSAESLDSVGRITLEFGVGTDISQALLKVNARLQQVREYPEQAEEPVLTTANSGDRPVAWFILRPKVASAATLAAEQARLRDAHPELAASLDPVLRAASTGLRLARLKSAAREHPELERLLPPATDITELRRFARDVIESRFERVPGVSNSNVLGGKEDELQVVVDPHRLASRGLTIGDVRATLRARNQDTSGGDFWEGKRRYVVRTLGRLRTPAEVEQVILARRDDKPVYVRDVASVRIGFKKPDGLVRNFGATALAINCLRETGANVLAVMDGLRLASAELNRGVLADRQLHLEQAYDETEYIYSAIGLVNQNIVVGGLLTIFVLLLFLRSGRSTLVLFLAIPTSIIGTFLVMNLSGRSLNVISLAGMAFAVGMLVDNAVVVLENIYRHYQDGDSRLRAAVRGTREVWGAVVASTLTTLAVFLPVLFSEEEAGQLFRDIALAISTAVGLSMVVSVIVIPTAASRILRRIPTPEKDAAGTGGAAAAVRVERRIRFHPLRLIDRAAAVFVDAVAGLNAWLHRSVLRQFLAVAIMIGGALGISLWMLPKVEYLPSGNRNLVFGILLPPPGYNLEELTRLGETIEARLRPYWDIDADDPATQRLPFPPIKDLFFVARNRQVFLGLRCMDPLRAAELIPLIQQVAGSEPGTFVVAKQSSLFEQGLSAGRTVDVEISGNQLEELVAVGREVLGRVRALIPGAQLLPQPSLDLSNPEVHIVPKWERVADMGISAADLGYAVDALVDGAYATDYYVGGDKIDLRIVGDGLYVQHGQDLRELPVATPGGNLVPLGSLADIELSSGPEQINHRERRRTITIQVSPPPEVALEDAMDRIRTEVVEPILARGDLDPSTQLFLAGTADKLKATWQSLRFNFLLALLIMYLLMAALFESWTYPLVIICSVPMGAVGGILGLRLLNVFVIQPLDVLTMLGFIILIGTVVNNAILIVHQALQSIRNDRMTLDDAIIHSVRTRIRPIFMTTLTTVFGLIPLVVYPGAGSELYRGLGSVLLGGLIVSTFFTLVLVPSLFHLLFRALSRGGKEDTDTAQARSDAVPPAVAG